MEANLCSFDGYKSSGTNTKYYQPYYTCKTCWGNKNEFYICVFCADIHHFEHDKVYTNLQVAISKRIQIVCNCAKNKHKIGCTKIITNEIQVLQPVYKCQTCHELNKRKNTETISRICYQCSIKCHKGHKIIEEDMQKFFCGCGKSSYITACYMKDN